MLVLIFAFAFVLRSSELNILSCDPQFFIMSTSDHRSRHCTYSRPQTRKRKAVLNVDLNVVPPGDNRDQVGPSTRSQSQECETNHGVAPIPPAPIDLEAFDDDVIISSPRAFAEAWVLVFASLFVCYFAFFLSFSSFSFPLFGFLPL